MKIKHYLYNSFIIEEGGLKIAIDPGRDPWIFRMNSLIPEQEWEGVTDIFVTHADGDHYDFVIPMAQKTGANIFCGEDLKDDFTSQGIKNVHVVEEDKILALDGISVKGVKVLHGPLHLKLIGGLLDSYTEVREEDRGGQEIFIGPWQVAREHGAMQVKNHGTVKLLGGLIRLEKDNIDFARGSIGFFITVGNKTLLNLGDTLLKQEWQGLKPDLLMIPIGGVIGNTMDIKAALEAIRLIQPRLVIPVHYNCAFFGKKNINPTDDKLFQSEVNKMGIECTLLLRGDETTFQS